jgi:anti-anti-sigma factor
VGDPDHDVPLEEETEPAPLLAHGAEQAMIESSVCDGVPALVVMGELDISNVGELRDGAAQMPADAPGLVVDLTDATFIDSATVGFLFELRQSLQRRGQALQVVSPPGGAAERVLAMTSFDADVCREPDLDSAVAAVRRGAQLQSD